MVRSKYIKRQIDYGWLNKNKKTKKIGNRIIRAKSKTELRKEVEENGE